MDKKAELPMIMVPAVALVVFGALFIYFLNFDNNGFVDSRNISMIIAETDFAQQYIVQNARLLGQISISGIGGPAELGNIADIKQRFAYLAERRNLGYIGAGNFFLKIREGDFEFKKEGEGHVLEIKGLKLRIQRGHSNMIRNFDLKINFDSAGNAKEILYG